MHDALGKTPLSYFQDLRIERAVYLLRTTDQGIDHIATEVGYAEGVTLRNLLRRSLGVVRPNCAVWNDEDSAQLRVIHVGSEFVKVGSSLKAERDP